MNETRRIVYNFVDGGIPANSGGADSGPWRKTLSGTGAVTKTTGGLAMASSAGVGVTALGMDDQLVYDIDEIISIEFLVKLATSSIAASRVFVGLASARNNDADVIAQQMSFSAAGSTALLVESDDNANENNDDIATGLTWTGDWQRLCIDLATGVRTQSPPFTSTGGTSNVQFKAGNASGALRPVATNTGFDMSAYTGGLQPLVQVNNGGSGDIITLTVREIAIELKLIP